MNIEQNQQLNNREYDWYFLLLWAKWETSQMIIVITSLQVVFVI